MAEWTWVECRGGRFKLDVDDLPILARGSYRIMRVGRQPWQVYVVRSSWKLTHYLHREVLGLTPGDGLETDHRNGDRLDNRRSNLRVATRAQNAQNVPARSGYRLSLIHI